MTNQAIAEVLDEIGDLLQIKGESLFRYQAYYQAANTIRSIDRDAEEIYQAGELTALPRIGKGLGAKIGEMINSGRCRFLEELQKEVPRGLRLVLHVPGVGPKTALLVHEKLGISTVEGLRQAAEEGRLRDIKGLGAKTEENILRGMAQIERRPGRVRLDHALAVARPIVTQLEAYPSVISASVAGSLRRWRETIGDIDLLASSEAPGVVMAYFCRLPQVVSVLMSGETKSSVLTSEGMQIDLRVVSPEQWGAALQYFTGSVEHNVRIRELAKGQGLKVNEYGVFETQSDKRVGGETEEEVYELVGMPWIPPNLRENRGEIEAALSGMLPRLVERGDLLGDLHVHTKESDGVDDLEEMLGEAERLGHRYILVTDHTEKLHVAGGLTPDEVREQRARIEELNRRLDGRLTVLHGAELNIDNEGEVDWPDHLLSQFDLTIASVHGGFRQARDQLTRRIVTAMRSPHIHIIGHPTGRLIGKRDPYDVDLDAVFRAAAETGTALELNAFPDRLDLKDEHLRAAQGHGVRIAIGTDAHRRAHLRYLDYGVATAQRAWLGPQDVLNTLAVPDLLEWARSKAARLSAAG